MENQFREFALKAHRIWKCKCLSNIASATSHEGFLVVSARINEFNVLSLADRHDAKFVTCPAINVDDYSGLRSQEVRCRRLIGKLGRRTEKGSRAAMTGDERTARSSALRVPSLPA